MKTFIVLAAFTAVVTAILPLPTPDQDINVLWSTFKSSNGKKYANATEELFRLKIFKDNIIRIAEHNLKFLRGETSFQTGINVFSDMLSNEVEALFTGLRMSNLTGLASGSGLQHQANETSMLGTPAAIDWRTRNMVTNVKNQGQCGSCWAFAAVGALEGQIARRTGRLVPLSEQNLIDCTTNNKYGNKGCNGGWMNPTFQYVRDNGGISTERSYPYEGQVRSCRYNRANNAGTVTGFVNIRANDERSLQDAVGNIGPVAVAIDASQWGFQNYRGGIYQDPNCSSRNLDHAVVVVGYGSEGGRDFWIVKNSWGNRWGDNGYIKMARNRNNHCGIASAASYPTV